MKTNYLYLFLILSCIPGLNAEEWLSYVRKDGRRIELHVVSATENQAVVELRDGSRHTLRRERLDPAFWKRIMAAPKPETVWVKPGTAPAEEIKAAKVKPVSIIPDTVKFRIHTTEHFRFYLPPDLPLGHMGIQAEKELAFISERVPSLPGVFKKKQSRRRLNDVHRAIRNRDKTFRYSIYVIDDIKVFREMLQRQLSGLNEDMRWEYERVAQRCLHFHDVEEGFSVYTNLNYGSTFTSSRLAGMATKAPHMPLWLKMGSSYTTAHYFWGRPTHHYVIFSTVDDPVSGYNPYEDANKVRGTTVQVASGKIFQKPWKPLLKKEALQNGLPVGLKRMLAVTRSDLLPIETAMSWPLFEFMTATPERRQIFAEVLARIGPDENPSAADVAQLYGFKSVEAFDAALLEFIHRW